MLEQLRKPAKATRVYKEILTTGPIHTHPKAKAERVPYPGLLQPLPIPHQAWSSVSIDFVEGLPKSEGRNCTSWPSLTLFQQNWLLEFSWTMFIYYNGLSTNIVTDRDKIFTSSFWKELFKLLGTNLNLSTAYHPQSDGQMERVNQCVENYFCFMCYMRPSQWNKWLSLAEYWYNTNFHTRWKLTPFQGLYGDVPGSLTIYPYIPREYLQKELECSGFYEVICAKRRTV
ncbi:Transposon Ty3-G Gag-Pol polyprotein [Sesamum angolense]|uniref:Transposon Ty3-G Gag-Pol polyprotein n=1 Tax=Sesamum angolense TaxID=2727404 RepID=A0AAE2C698_9LAMI|nr:Transposon Ty3-G Gag-Pol polyprotein [Sesamum angolense]